MQTIELNGIKYTKRKEKWVNQYCIVAPTALQKELNSLYLKSLAAGDMSPWQIMDEADFLKKSSSYGEAVRLYECALLKADDKTTAYILPRITSCYRKMGMPHKAIELFSTARKKFGNEIITPVLLTSAAAAYCDMEEYDKALWCCNKAYAMTDGKPCVELALVYDRIKSLTE